MLAIKNTLKTVGKIIDSLQELSEEQKAIVGSDIQGKVQLTITLVFITPSQTLSLVFTGLLYTVQPWSSKLRLS